MSAPTTTPTCPKCGHVRSPLAQAPAWQCPACGIAYHKYQAYLARARAGVAPRRVEDGLPRLTADTSMWSLVVVNVIAVVTALVLDWQLVDLMLVYWIQSVMIGASYFARIMALDEFSTEDFRINDRPVEPTESTKRQTAGFFVVHYGGFHLGYLVFILADAPGTVEITAGLWLCAIAFAVNHWFSYRYHRDVDRQGKPNIGTLMFTPYARIVPMHVCIVFGAVAMEAAGLLLFGLLKTVADVLMHHVEHRTLAGQSGAVLAAENQPPMESRSG